MRPKYEKRVLTPYEDEVSISRLIEIQSDEKNVASFFFFLYFQEFCCTNASNFNCMDSRNY